MVRVVGVLLWKDYGERSVAICATGVNRAWKLAVKHHVAVADALVLDFKLVPLHACNVLTLKDDKLLLLHLISFSTKAPALTFPPPEIQF